MTGTSWASERAKKKAKRARESLAQGKAGREAVTRRRTLRRTTRYTPGGIVINQWTKIRFAIVGVFVSLCFLGVAVKAYGLQVRDADRYRELAERQHLRTIEIPAPRGTIYDRNHTELAVNADADSVFANPRKIVDVAHASESLSKALGLDIREVEAKLATPKHFVWLKRHVLPDEASAVSALDLEGVEITQEPRRFYPGKKLAGHILGFAGIDGAGLDGLELGMDAVLAGQRAKVATLRDANGGLAVDDPTAKATPGASMTLTIDRAIQFAAERAVREAVEKNRAKSAVAVVLDVKNGDVLAIASYPDFDPNNPAATRGSGARNRAITDAYEVGSVMKVFSIATALESGVVSPSTVFDTEGGRYRYAGKTFRDSFHDQDLTVSEILKRSSNVGMVKISALLGATTLREGFVALGFGARTNIELPGEVAGVLHPTSVWREIGLATHSFGYGMTSTPLQVTAAMAAVGNGGVYVEPRTILSVQNHMGEELYTRTPQTRRVLSKKTTEQLIPMMVSVFEHGEKHGTAQGLFVPGYEVAGKTGTAHKYDAKTGSYGEDLYLSSFSGLAPADDPRVAVTVLVDEPSAGEYYGGRVAGPAWTQIVGETMAVLGVPADAELLAVQEALDRKYQRRLAWRQGLDWDKMQRKKKKEEVPVVQEDWQTPALAVGGPEASTSSTQIPNLVGLGLAKAMKQARAQGIQLRFRGSGRVIDQSVQPGAPYQPVMEVVLTDSAHAFGVQVTPPADDAALEH